MESLVGQANVSVEKFEELEERSGPMTDAVDFLEHYGVRGMRWGVRRQLKKLPSSERGAYLKSKDAKWLAKVEAKPKLSKISKLTSKYAKREIKNLKKDYKK